MKRNVFVPLLFENTFSSFISVKRVLFFFTLCALLYGLFFVQNFSGPLADLKGGDINQWDYMGYYVAQNLSFTPLPHINWINDQTFYPYGTNHVFQGWAFEQNFWYALCFSFFGNGPWLNIYYLLSLFVLSSGTYMLLKKDYGDFRALIAGFLICYFNFYALNKYPGHYAYAIIHWTVLSILTDFILTRNIIIGIPVSFRFILLKITLLLLCLGHDVGYILGYALSSFTLNSIFLIITYFYQYRKKQYHFTANVKNLVSFWLKDFKLYKATCLIMIGISLLVGFLYIPLLIEVATQANSFHFIDRFSGGHGWVHPLRLFMPFLPGFSIDINPLTHYLHDMSEGNGGGSVGWFLLILGAVGFWRSSFLIRIAYIPLLIFGLMHALYHPIQVPTLQIFPWDRFNRIPSRVTLIYPVIMIIFGLHWTGKVRPIYIIALCLIGLTEAFAVYSFRNELKPYYYLDSFSSYMNRIKQQPGEAILDWPFCVVGGNGVGIAEDLCPLYQQTNTLYALQRFHGKKSVGQYFGRLHESQIKPFVKAGWPNLLDQPDDVNFLYAKKLTSCLEENEWTQFMKFYLYNDFAGINLCIDLIPKSCTEEFYKRFGKAVATTYVPGVGRMVFIPKLMQDRKMVDRKLGFSLQFSCNCPLLPQQAF